MTKFKKGKSGNPGGRPQGSVSITSAIKRKLAETNPTTKRLYVDDVVDVLIEKAVIEKDPRVLKEIWNHIDGSPRQTLDGAVPVIGMNMLLDSNFGDHKKRANEAIKLFLENSYVQ